MNHPYADLIERALAAGRIHQRWTEHSTGGGRSYVTVDEYDYAQLLFLAGFAPCAECGKIEINVRHDTDGDWTVPRHAYKPLQHGGGS